MIKIILSYLFLIFLPIVYAAQWAIKSIDVCVI